MNLSNFMEQLSYGELSDVYMGIDGDGAIDPRHIPKIVHFINDGLTRLHVRFPLKIKEFILETQEGKSGYVIDPKYAESRYDSESGIIPYIKDLTEDYTGDLLKILKVFDQYGKQLPLNDPDLIGSVSTPQWNIVQVPISYQGYALTFTYQARHVVITPDLECEQEIILPDTLEGALLAYVGHRTYQGRNTQESAAKSAEFLGSFNAICDEAEAKDMLNSSVSATKPVFEQRGFR